MASTPSDDYPSDTDLLCGLPSPDTSDDEDIKKCQDLGIVVPHFCNKLRTLTQHLFLNTEPVVLSDLFDEGNTPEKAESRKKSSKEDTDVSGKSMTRSGGCVPGPRWTRSPSTMRSYDPCDITGDDEFEIAGVVFRNSFSAKDKSRHWSRDNDFPSLNESSQSDMSELSKSNDTSLGPLGSLTQESKMAHFPCVLKVCVSPISSTPSHTKNRSSLLQESPMSLPQRQPRMSPLNTESLRCDYTSKLEPKANSRSGSKGNRRRSKKLSHNPSDGGNSPSLDSPICDFNANNFVHHPGCTDGFKCELCLEVESRNVDTNKRSISQSQTNNSNQMTTVEMDRMSSPVLHGLPKKSDISNDRLDARCNYSANNSSPTWSNIVKTSPHLSPVMRIDSPTNYMQDYHPLSGRNEPKPVEIVKKVAFNNGKNLCNDDGEPAPISTRKSNSGKKHRVQLMSVDSCVTPSKKSDNDNWPSNNNADVLAFENRFVEKIAVNSTSPPKKVNPLPIKKLDFSQRTRDNASLTGSGKENKGGMKNESVCRRQVSMISDLDWKKSTPIEKSNRNTRGNSSGNKEKTTKGRRSMFSLEDYMKTKESSKIKDDLHKEEADEREVQSSSETKTKVDAFWVTKRVAGADELKTCKLGSGHRTVIEDVKGVASMKLVESNQDIGVDDLDRRSDQIVADVKQVTLKAHLRRYARRYCYFVEGHYVMNVSREVLFILQLLTCSDSQIVRELDWKTGHTVFGSIHNCVYFAVLVIKRLKRLFSCLPKTTLCLLTSNYRIKAFSPKLYNFLKAYLVGKVHGTNEDVLTGNPQDCSLLGSSHLWSSSFSDSKMAHIFKCQRDNFFALYQRYQDSTVDHPFQMGEQIHYVYDPQILEHNSVVNLMHLAQLFLDHLLQSSFKHSSDQVNFLEMVISRETDNSLFKKKFEKWKQSNSSLKFGSPPRWDENELFFKDFIDAMRCPSFNELMKNIIVSKILELNGTDFGYLKNLHSSVCLPDDQTPQRCEKFTTTVRCRCILGKMLGYLVFAPYSGGEDLSAKEIHQIVTVRDMVPLPLPLSLMLKQACDHGHLSLTVPWVVQYLSMMDAMAPKLAAYSQLISQLSSIHRHSWKNLFCQGHHNTGLLLTSCTSWLFENPALPQGLICPQLFQSDVFLTWQPPQTCLDTQRVVTSHLLYACCPYLNAGHIPLVMFALNHKAVSGKRQVMPLTPDPKPESITPYRAGDRDVEELCQWLGNSLQSPASDGMRERTEIKSGESKGDQHYVKQPVSFVVYHNNARNALGELAFNFLKGHPYLSNCVHRTVELMCGKVQDYALNTILKLGIFEARVKVRRKFFKMDSGEDADDVKTCILANSNIIAKKFSSAAKQAFFQTGERVCQVELSNLINFLASHVEESTRTTAIDIAQRSVMSQLVEWAELQLDYDVFHRAVVGEAEKVASTWHFKPCSLYPSNYLRKPEYSATSLEKSNGFEDMQQLSKVLDTALACGGWYMNGQTRGPRPDDVFIQSLMEDFMACINNHNVSMDFSFSIMINFLMHLIIQYITDAPQNWTNGCLETFINLCILYESKKSEDDRLSFQPIESSHKSQKIKIKVTNLMSVYSLGWLSKAQELDHSLMVYCHTMVRLVEAGLVTVEKVMERLISTRVNHYLSTATKFMIDRIMVKVLELLFTSGSDEGTRFSTERIVSLVLMIGQHLAEWDSGKAVTELHQTFADALAGTIDDL